MKGVTRAIIWTIVLLVILLLIMGIFYSTGIKLIRGVLGI